MRVIAAAPAAAGMTRWWPPLSPLPSGRNTVTLGSMPKGRAGLIGTKIAFTRIPDAAEFND